MKHIYLTNILFFLSAAIVEQAQQLLSLCRYICEVGVECQSF